MNAEIVYQVAKALSREEQLKLLEKLKQDFKPEKLTRHKQRTFMTREEAREYLLKNVFGKNKKA